MTLWSKPRQQVMAGGLAHIKQGRKMRMATLAAASLYHVMCCSQGRWHTLTYQFLARACNMCIEDSPFLQPVWVNWAISPGSITYSYSMS